MPRAQQHTSLLIPCAHGKLNVKHYRTTPKPETHITSRGRSCAGEKIENRAPKLVHAQQLSSSGTATTTTRHHHDYHPHVRQQGTKFLGGTCTSISASCCYCCRSVLLFSWLREPAPAKRGTCYQKGGASRSVRPAGRQGGTHLYYLLAVGRAFL